MIAVTDKVATHPFLEHIIVPIAVFVVTTAGPPEKLSWSARRIFPNIWWEDVFRNRVHRFAEAGPL
jgi:hypothetical protein